MVQLALAFVAAALVSVQASPFHAKRIAQTIDQSTTLWEDACDSVTKGSAQCNELSVNAFQTLLAGAGPCDQQNAADELVSYSKQLNSPQMVALAQLFSQQARNSPNSVSTPYCQQAPQNPELNGLYQCQFSGSNPKVFVGNLAVGQPGTIPFGMTAPLNPLGSCPAHPEGPIADGSQLTSITTTPFASGSTAADSTTSSSTATAPGSDDTPPTPTPTPSAPSTSDDVDDDGNCPAPSSATSTSVPDPAPSNSGTPPNLDAVSATSATAPAPAPSSSGGFQFQNGLDAQKLNSNFATLNANSPCTEPQTACVNGMFAQCVGTQFDLTSCAPTLQCFALPLVNSPGTSITCDTQANALDRFAASGVTGGITG